MMNGGRGPFSPSRPSKCIILTCTIALIFSLKAVSQSWRLLMTPSQQARTQNRSVASSIVHQTYQNVFSYLTTDCPVQTTIGRCIKRVYRDENKTVPWWFQTMLRDAPNHVSGSWHNQSALNVTFNRRDLEFCAIEKVGTKHWRKFFCRLRNEKQDEQRPFCAHVDVAEDSSKAVFLRDPLERYLSGYMDK